MSGSERKVVRVSSDDFEVGKKKKSKIYQQHYRKEWEKLPDFKNWLQSVPGQSTRAYCIVCKKHLHAHRLTLMKHTCTAKHARMARALISKDLNKSTEECNEYASDSTEHNKSSEPDSSRIESDTVIVYLDASNKTTADDSNTNLNYSGNESEDNRPEVIEEGAAGERPEITEDKATQTPAEDGDLIEIDGTDVVNGNNDIDKRNNYINVRKNLFPQPPVTVNLYETGRGCPIAGVLIILYRLQEGRWVCINERVSDPLGDCKDLIERKDFTIGRYKIHVDIGRYYEFRNTATCFPYIEIVFDVRSEHDHIHFPLLLNPFGYTTYRNSNMPV